MNKKIFSILIAAAIFSNTGVLAVNTANERSSNGESVLSGGDKSSNNNLTESLTEDLEEDLPVDNNPPAAPTELLTNELERPLNAENISFRWVVNDMDLDEVQTAYEMIVTDGVTGETVWDSGKVSSSEQSNVLYDGETLKEGYPYKWKVKTWDKNDEQSPYSEEAEFASGISDENWDAYWISDGTGGAKVTQGKYNHYWYVRGEGEIDGEKEIAKVLGYFSAEQDYKLYVNNEEIGRGQSFDYASETRYQGWDITEAAKKNPSKLTVGALVRTYGPGQGRAATDAGFIGRINVYYTDGTSTVINTDKDWKVSKTVPLSGTARRNGEGDFVEEYNAANAQDDFTSSEYDISSWSSVSVLGRNTTGAVTAMYPELSKTNAGEVHPVSVKKLSDGTVVADFGRVIPARAVIKFSNGKAGNKVTLLGGYVLKSDGTIDSSKNQSTDMRWIYTQKDGEQVYKTWDHLAFRYISISGSDEKLAEDSISAELVYTDAPIQYKSTLITSNSVLNSVYDLMQNSALYSIQNSFVDTPTREKGQFLQDAINISEASTATLYERAASKKAIEQFMASADRYWTGDETGRLNSVYPNGDGKRDIPDFTVNFPYWVYNYYMETGDKDLLKRAYPYVKNTADYISRYISADTGLVTKLGGGDGSPDSYQYGIVDWPSDGRFGYDWSGTKEGARTTVNMLSKRAFDVTALMAAELNNNEDSQDYKNRSGELKTAINDNLMTSDGLYCDGLNADGIQSSIKSQHSNSYAAAFDIVPANKSETVTKYFVDKGMKQGPMTADILVKALIKENENEALLKLLTDRYDYGWAKEVNNGYSFTFEAWQADEQDYSQSHGWGAAAASDIIKSVTGVSNLLPGAAKIKIAPKYLALTDMSARVYTERGAVDVKYERNEESYSIKINVPSNIEAEVELPVIGDGKFTEILKRTDDGIIKDNVQLFNIGSGEYEFTYEGDITIQPEKKKESPIKRVIEYDLSTNEKISSHGSRNEDAVKEETVKIDDFLSIDFKAKNDGVKTDVSSSGFGLDLRNDSSAAIFTVPYDGTLTFNTQIRSGSYLYLTQSADNSGGDRITSSDVKHFVNVSKDVNAGETYRLYNVGTGVVSVKSIKYSYEEEPDEEPTSKPTEKPTEEPTSKPTEEPTEEPTEKPTEEPTSKPTEEPTQKPVNEENGIEIKESNRTDTSAEYQLKIKSPENGLVIVAVYSSNGALFGVKRFYVDSEFKTVNLELPQNISGTVVKFMLWDNGMKPISKITEINY